MNIYKIIKGSVKNFPYSIVCRETTISTHSSKTEALKYRAIYYNGDNCYALGETRRAMEIKQ